MGNANQIQSCILNSDWLTSISFCRLTQLEQKHEKMCPEKTPNFIAYFALSDANYMVSFLVYWGIWSDLVVSLGTGAQGDCQ